MKEFLAALGVLLIAFGVAKLVLALWQKGKGSHE